MYGSPQCVLRLNGRELLFGEARELHGHFRLEVRWCQWSRSRRVAV